MKVALVTGAGKGLGAGFVEYLASNNYIVYAGVHHLAGQNQKNDKNTRVIELDVEDDDSISKAIEIIESEQGKIDLLVNNAGVNKDSATSGHKEFVSELDSLDRQSLLKMFDINAVSPIILLKHTVKLMTGPQAFVINISSDRASLDSAMVDNFANYGYKASKIALNMMTKVAQFDLPKNVSIIAVHPGGVHTNMNPGGQLEPVEAAAKICEIIAQWRPELNGQFVNNDGTIRY